MNTLTQAVYEVEYDPSIITTKSLEEFSLYLGEKSGKSLAVVTSSYEAHYVKSHLECMINDVHSYVVTMDSHTWPAIALRDHIDQINIGDSEDANVIVTTKDVLHLALTDGLSDVSYWCLFCYGTQDLFSTHNFTFHDECEAAEFITYFNVAQSTSSPLMTITPTPQGSKLIQNIMQGGGEVNWNTKSKKDFMKFVSSSALSVQITCEDYNKIMKMKSSCYHKRYTKVSTFSVFEPEVFGSFKSVVVRAPFFEKSIMYAILKAQGFAMKETTLGKASGSTHPNGSRVSMYYISDGANSTKYKDTRPLPDSSKDYEDYIVEYYIGMIGHEKFVYCANEITSRKPVYTKYNSVTLDAEDGQGVPLSFVTETHGQYDYGIYTRSGIYNESERSSLIAFGIEPKVIDQDLEFLLAYEFAVATSLSDPNAKSDVALYMISEVTASALRNVFPGAVTYKVTVPNVVSGKKKLSDMPISYNDYKSYQRVNKKFHEGARDFPQETASRYIKTCEAGGFHLVNGNCVYNYIKSIYG